MSSVLIPLKSVRPHIAHTCTISATIVNLDYYISLERIVGVRGVTVKAIGVNWCIIEIAKHPRDDCEVYETTSRFGYVSI